MEMTAETEEIRVYTHLQFSSLLLPAITHCPEHQQHDNTTKTMLTVQGIHRLF